MDHYLIKPGGPLSGTVRISGAKNAALPILAASLLSEEALEIENLPHIGDIESMLSLLRTLGVQVARGRERVVIRAREPLEETAPAAAVKAMRASILVLGPMLARMGKARIALPGGCAIGARPVDLHLAGLTKMGASIHVMDEVIEAEASGLRGAQIHFDKVTVTGTENLMAAAVLADGVTVLHNAAREPEVIDLATFLISMGARISGQGTATITIEGVKRLGGARHWVMPDRIEAGTFICAAAATGGHVKLTHTEPAHLRAFLGVMRQAGLPMEVQGDVIEVFPHHGLRGVEVRTDPYPGFPTDLQAQTAAALLAAEGRSRIEETIFENRMGHFKAFQAMGAELQLSGTTAVLEGVLEGTPALSGGMAAATDLRAGAALVIAALAAKGPSRVTEIHHVARGYADFVGKLCDLGASVTYETGPVATVCEDTIRQLA